MIDPSFFYQSLKKNGISFFTGVPDSLLKEMLTCIFDKSDAKSHIIAANEGNALAIAAGYYLSSGKIPLVYLQNSGLGNIINPLTSLVNHEVSAIPSLLLIGWRGREGEKDEPQHKKIGGITLEILKLLNIKYYIINSDTRDMESIVAEAHQLSIGTKSPVALVISKGTFSPYSVSNGDVEKENNMSREEAIETILNTINKDDVIISTTGKTSRELYELRKFRGESNDQDFLNIGSMGHTSSIAMGVCINTKKRVFCFDGDGSLLMHLGAITIIGNHPAPKRLTHIIFNNSSHESVGGQPTIAGKINIVNLALSANYKNAKKLNSKEELIKTLTEYEHLEGPCLIEIMIRKGSRKDLGRPNTSPEERSLKFQEYILNAK